MNRSFNPLAAALLVIGTAFGFTAHAALPSESAPTPKVQVNDGPTAPESPATTFHRRLACIGDICPK